MAYKRFFVLMWADVLAWYSIWTMTTYLTDVWKLGITHSTAIVNIWMGICFTLQPIFWYLAGAITGRFATLFFSSIAYCIGLGFLSMSTPPVLSNSTNTCSDYKPECLGHTQKILFYIALPLIAVGISGHTASLLTSIGEQNETVLITKQIRPQVAGSFAIYIVPLFGAFALPYIEPWSLRFGIPAICTLLATLILFGSSCSPNAWKGPIGSPITYVFRVIKASASKIMWTLSDDPNELYEREDPDELVLPHTDGLRWLDKAAIKLPTNEVLNENNKWRLCSVTEVELTKIAIRVLPMWITFIMCGVVSSLGNTYFQEQAKRMNPKVGEVKIPLQVFLLIYQLAKEKIFDDMYSNLINYLTISGFKRYVTTIGIAIAMVFSILCCITAAKIETRRLHIGQTHYLLKNPEAKVPMSMFLLVPQYLLLAGLDTFMMNSVASAFPNWFPHSLRNYVHHLAYGVFNGLGCFSSVLLVFTVGKISKKGGNLNWFKHSLNHSRLDNYYWALASLSTVNLFLFILAAGIHFYKKSTTLDDELPATQIARGEYVEVLYKFFWFEKRVKHNEFRPRYNVYTFP